MSYRRRRLVASLLLALPLSCLAQSVPALDWGPCDLSESVISEGHPRATVSCARLRVPLNYDAPEAGTLDVPVMRIRTGDYLQERPAIFFNFGGPGHDPRESLERMAANWIDVSPDDEVLGDYARVAERFDLVTVVPRGMDGAHPLTCDFRRPLPLHELYENRDSNRAWRGMLELTRSYADECGKASRNLGVDNDTYVHDIESFRIAGGYAKLGFYGSSYGSLVALWYAATYPAQVGHVVLDGLLDVTQSWDGRIRTGLDVRDEAFVDAVVQPAADAPDAYGLGTKPEQIVARLMRMPLALRMAWQAEIRTPEDALAAVTLSEWLTGGRTKAQVYAALETHDFSPVPEVNYTTIKSAVRLYEALSHDMYGPGANHDDSERLKGPVNLAIQCNDASWHRDVDLWRRFLLNGMGWSFSLGEGDIVTSLVCAQWLPSAVRAPDFRSLSRMKALVLNGEFDRITPWKGAQATMALMPNSRALLARGSADHGVLNKSFSPCIERTTAHYLLTGSLPAKPVTQCHYVPNPD